MENQTVFVRPPVWALLAAVVVGGFFYLGGKKMEQRPQMESSISVSGEGKVSAAPDVAQLSFGVRVERVATSKEAMDTLAKGMDAVLKALQAEGIAKKDIQTQQLSLSPSYDYRNGTTQLRGYEANQMLTVKVRDLSKVSDVLGAAANAGANQAGDVRFTIDNPEKLQAQARSEAIAEAKAKAQQLAKQLGVGLGELKGFSENGGGYYPPVPMAMSRDMAAGGAVAQEAAAPALPEGEQEITVTVNLNYGIR